MVWGGPGGGFLLKNGLGGIFFSKKISQKSLLGEFFLKKNLELLENFPEFHESFQENEKNTHTHTFCCRIAVKHTFQEFS